MKSIETLNQIHNELIFLINKKTQLENELNIMRQNIAHNIQEKTTYQNNIQSTKLQIDEILSEIPELERQTQQLSQESTRQQYLTADISNQVQALKGEKYRLESELQLLDTRQQIENLNSEANKAKILTLTNNIKSVTNSLNNTLSQKVQLNEQLVAQQRQYELALNNLNQIKIHQNQLIIEKNAQEATFKEALKILSNFKALDSGDFSSNQLLAETLPSKKLQTLAKNTQIPKEFDEILSKLTNLDYQNPEGKTLIMHVADIHFFYGVNKLLEKGANLYIQDFEGRDMLMRMSGFNSPYYVNKIVDQSQINNIDSQKNTALHYVTQLFQKYCGVLCGIDRLKNDIYYGYATGIQLGGTLIFHSENNKPIEFNLDLNSGGSGKQLQLFGLFGQAGCTWAGNYKIPNPNTGRTSEEEFAAQIIDTLISHGANINYQNIANRTPFMYVCANKSNALANYLLDKYDINVNLTDLSGWNALHWALDTKDKTVVEKVIKKGVDINAQDNEKCTALALSANYVLPDIADILFNKYNAQDLPEKDGRTAWDLATLNMLPNLINVFIDKKGITHKSVDLWIATRKGDIAVVESLLDQDIDLNGNIKNFHNTTPLIQAITHHYKPIIKLLLEKGADVNKSDDIAPPLYYALGFDNPQGVDIEIIQTLIDKNVNIDQPTKINKNTPFHLACINNHQEAIFYLLKHKASINCQNIENRTPFDYVCANKNSILANYLLDKYKIDVNSTDILGWNALHWALELKNKIIIEKIIKKGVDINAQDNKGCTALFWSAKYILPDIADLLFNKYDAQDLPEKSGCTAWDVATLNILPSLINVFISKKEVDPKSVELWIAARRGDIAAIEGLLNQGADINCTIKNLYNTTPLIQTVIFHHKSCIELLLNKKADVNKSDSNEASPLYYSLGFNLNTIDLEIVTMLVENNANTNQPMYDGDTPLHMANYSGNKEAILYLLNHNANINTQNDSGKTPLYCLLDRKNLSSEIKIDILSAILNANTIDFSIKDNESETIIDYANKHCYETIELLHQYKISALGEGLNEQHAS